MKVKLLGACTSQLQRNKSCVQMPDSLCSQMICYYNYKNHIQISKIIIKTKTKFQGLVLKSSKKTKPTGNQARMASFEGCGSPTLQLGDRVSEVAQKPQPQWRMESDLAGSNAALLHVMHAPHMKPLIIGRSHHKS